MRSVAFYHKDTGVLHQQSVMCSDDSLLSINTPPDHVAIDQPDGFLLNPDLHRIDVATGEVIRCPPKQPTSDHVWNDELRRWVLSPEVVARSESSRQIKSRIDQLESRQSRAIREHLLGDPLALKRLADIDRQIASLRSELGEEPP